MMNILCRRFQRLTIVIVGAIALSDNCAFAQIIQDSTLPNNSQVKIQGNITIIEGGTQLESNLFHSFKEFSVLNGNTAEFKNTEGVQNIISRVTGKSISNIDGILKANGTANLFLINPNGIIFGKNASLNIGGSFVASTASSLNFADGTKFSATNYQTTSLLTVSVPSGLQFGATAAPIHNRSQASPNGAINSFSEPVGLQVPTGKTLALVSGDILMEGGSLTAVSGRIELGSVAANSLVSLNSNNQNWTLGYQSVQNFQKIQLIRRTVDGSEIPSTVDVSGIGGGNIQVQGKVVELNGPFVRLRNRNNGIGEGGELTITTRQLIIRDGAQIFASTRGKGTGGNLTVNAFDSVEVTGTFTMLDNRVLPSTLSSTTTSDGKAGDVTINTGKLYVRDGAEVSTESSGIVLPNSQFIPATGQGGNLNVKASESVEIIGTSANGFPSGLRARTLGSGEAGKVKITTGQLIIRDGATITVNSQVPQNRIYLGDPSKLGSAGELNIIARSILLDQGTLTSNSQSGKGGNITLQARDLLLMRRNSQISTNAEGNGDGGNITINARNGFIVAPIFGNKDIRNNDITANANFGSGGKITITTKNIFGFVTRTRADVESLDTTGEINPNNLPTNDITAFSQQNPNPLLDGIVEINSPDVDPSKGLVELPVNLVDPSQQIAAGCGSGAKMARSSFNNIGRGGTTPDPTQPLMADAVLADWITLNPESENRVEGMKNRVVVGKQQDMRSHKQNSVNEPSEIVEAQGWVTDANGKVVLVAEVPTATPYNSSLTAASCAAN
ncbi:MAG: filamentous hemagglutinin N-terminal domain-containing protein [Nostoc sp. SerVER01]|nr:filamentous hemagglutinin N-terminal domain-containing protein [Nostoc sp. SerVER01]